MIRVLFELVWGTIWFGFLGAAVIVFFVGLGVAISGNLAGGIIILALDWGFVELIKPGRFVS